MPFLTFFHPKSFGALFCAQRVAELSELLWKGRRRTDPLKITTLNCHGFSFGHLLFYFVNVIMVSCLTVHFLSLSASPTFFSYSPGFLYANHSCVFKPVFPHSLWVSLSISVLSSHWVLRAITACVSCVCSWFVPHGLPVLSSVFLLLHFSGLYFSCLFVAWTLDFGVLTLDFSFTFSSLLLFKCYLSVCFEF